LLIVIGIPNILDILAV